MLPHSNIQHCLKEVQPEAMLATRKNVLSVRCRCLEHLVPILTEQMAKQEETDDVDEDTWSQKIAVHLSGKNGNPRLYTFHA